MLQKILPSSVFQHQKLSFAQAHDGAAQLYSQAPTQQTSKENKCKQVHTVQCYLPPSHGSEQNYAILDESDENKIWNQVFLQTAFFKTL